MCYAFRAECQPDIDRFLILMNLLGMRRSITRIVTHRKAGWPDVTCVFETKDMSLAGLVKLFSMMEDGHVMAQTVNTARKFTGERIRKS